MTKTKIQSVKFVQRTYHSETISELVSLVSIREHYIQHGENIEWINFVISQLREGKTVVTRFCKLEPVIDL